MQHKIYQKVLSFVFVFAILSCSKIDSPVTDDTTITNEIHLNTLFNLINIEDGFLISGISNSKVTISKLNVNFGIIWNKDNYEWGTTFSTGGWGGSFYAVDIIKIIVDKNGNYTCFCSITEGGDVIWSSVLVVKLDRFGNEINKIELDNTALINVTETNDNGYMLFGNKLIKLNADLSQEWENNDQNYVFTGAFIIPTNDNGLALTGTWNSDQVFLQKFDGKGVLQWTKRNYNQKPFNDLGYDLVQLTNGGFLIIGRTRNLKPPLDMNCLIIRTDIAGDTLWTKKYGGKSNEWLENFLFASENDYIIKETVGFANDTIHKTILTRITADGQIIDSKETNNFEKLLYVPSGYFVKAEKAESNNIKLSKVLINDLFSK